MTLGTQEELGWGQHANCYAYAFKCQQPVNGQLGGATPGSAARNNGTNVPNNSTRAQQVVLDSGGTVTILAGTTLNVPNPSNGCYLVAMLENNGGFHFIRRDSLTGRWSWKDGNNGTVKYNVLDFPADKYIYINNDNLHDLIVTRPNDFVPWGYGNMNLTAFFDVPNNGMNVAR